MSLINTVVNEFLKVLKASSSCHLVRWLLHALALSQAIQPSGWPPNYQLTDGEKFDFIVVGAGSAGAVVATRLSEVTLWKVLLIEAGGDPPPSSVVPSLFATLQHTEYDWDYTAYLDKGVGKAHPDGKIFMSRGKMLGGSSSSNYEIYVRGVPQDYDEWGQLASGWNWNTVLYYFNKLERMTDPSVFENPYNAYLHSTDGPVGVSRPKTNPYFAEINEIRLNAFQEIGIKRVLENNGLDTKGVARPHFTFANGRRSSTAEAYLRPTKDRPNFHIAKFTRVTKVLIDPDSLKTYGVEAIQENGRKINVYAKEVILSAGTIDTPKILMLSGIGPVEQSMKLGIPPIADLPVGQNLHDHSFIPIIFTGKRGLESIAQNILVTTELDSFPVPIQCGFFSVDYSIQHKAKPQFQFFNINIGATASPLVAYGCKTILNFEDSVCLSLAKANLINEMDITSLILLHPLSRGQVTLRSKNPSDDPVIEMGYFRNENDLELAVEGLKFMSRLKNATYYRKVGGDLVKLDITACRGLRWGSDKYWRCYAKSMVGSLLHPVGTCRMGPSGVVDGNLRVYGVSGLRVADASIMPKIPSGNTNAPTMMIGEHAADIIKANYCEVL